MSKFKENQATNSDFDASWIPVFIMLCVFWPVGLYMLYNKIKKSQTPEQRRRKPISWMSVGLCAAGVGLLFNGRMTSLFMLIGGGALFSYSRKMKSDERKFNKYARIIGTRNIVPISAIAAAMPTSYEEAKRDLQKMIDDGYFGRYSYIDMQHNHFVLDSRVGTTYVDELVEKFKKKRAEQPEAPAQAEAPKAGNEFQQKLAEIRAANEAIKDPDISAKIYRIEQITGSMFELVNQNPSKRSEINTFMNYYLPTTLKLLNSYSVLEKQSVAGDNIQGSKSRIEKMVDQLVWAFERQLDQMFESEARDISSDITVLESMMARDGLTENKYNFPKQPNRGGSASQAVQQEKEQE